MFLLLLPAFLNWLVFKGRMGNEVMHVVPPSTLYGWAVWNDETNSPESEPTMWKSQRTHTSIRPSETLEEITRGDGHET